MRGEVEAVVGAGALDPVGSVLHVAQEALVARRVEVAAHVRRLLLQPAQLQPNLSASPFGNRAVVVCANTRLYPTIVRIIMFTIGLEGHGWLIRDN